MLKTVYRFMPIMLFHASEIMFMPMLLCSCMPNLLFRSCCDTIMVYYYFILVLMLKPLCLFRKLSSELIVYSWLAKAFYFCKLTLFFSIFIKRAKTHLQYIVMLFYFIHILLSREILWLILYLTLLILYQLPLYET
jgi:hypothetical protein